MQNIGRRCLGSGGCQDPVVIPGTIETTQGLRSCSKELHTCNGGIFYLFGLFGSVFAFVYPKPGNFFNLCTNLLQFTSSSKQRRLTRSSKTFACLLSCQTRRGAKEFLSSACRSRTSSSTFVRVFSSLGVLFIVFPQATVDHNPAY